MELDELYSQIETVVNEHSQKRSQIVNDENLSKQGIENKVNELNTETEERLNQLTEKYHTETEKEIQKLNEVVNRKDPIETKVSKIEDRLKEQVLNHDSEYGLVNSEKSEFVQLYKLDRIEQRLAEGQDKDLFFRQLNGRDVSSLNKIAKKLNESGDAKKLSWLKEYSMFIDDGGESLGSVADSYIRQIKESNMTENQKRAAKRLEKLNNDRTKTSYLIGTIKKHGLKVEPTKQPDYTALLRSVKSGFESKES